MGFNMITESNRLTYLRASAEFPNGLGDTDVTIVRDTRERLATMAAQGRLAPSPSSRRKRPLLATWLLDIEIRPITKFLLKKGRIPFLFGIQGSSAMFFWNFHLFLLKKFSLFNIYF